MIESFSSAFIVLPRLNSVRSRALASSILLIASFATPAAAQRALADSARADSLARRLQRAEDAIRQLQQQMSEQGQSGVVTKSRMQLELTGRVLVHASSNDRLVNNADDPQFVRPDAGTDRQTPFVFSARQTTLGAVLSASDVLGGRFTGDIDVDFVGGQQTSSGGRNFPLLRIRTARAAVRYAHGEIMAGQESPLIAGVNPVSPAAIGTPAFAGAGNLWLWLPQLRGTLETSSAVRLGVQGAVLANITGDGVGSFDTDVDVAERTGKPAFEGRVRVRWGDDIHPGEIGCGGHIGWVLPTTAAEYQTNVVTCDAKIAVGAHVDLRGEIYNGRGVRGLGGGGIGQNLNSAGKPLEDNGGWGQLNIDVTPQARFGAGCGVDAPSESSVPAGGRLRNHSCAAYSILRPSGPIFLGLEARGIETKYAAGTFRNYHFNLSMGFEF